jgi:methylated-DNA-protein-cysteine methyltransferase related protein
MISSIKDKNKDFFENVHDVARLIPAGRVTSYGAIAKYLGTARSSRMVGWAMNKAHSLSGIPAHRVVNRVGLLTGKAHFNPPSKMEELLLLEGVKVENDQIINLDAVFWDPMIELALE